MQQKLRCLTVFQSWIQVENRKNSKYRKQICYPSTVFTCSRSFRCTSVLRIAQLRSQTWVYTCEFGELLKLLTSHHFQKIASSIPTLSSVPLSNPYPSSRVGLQELEHSPQFLSCNTLLEIFSLKYSKVFTTN